VYFKRGGQSHEQAALRQVVVKVRVVNHRLNPDPGEFKPAGEVAEPPQDPNAPNSPATTKAPESEERAELTPPADGWITLEVNTQDTAAMPGDEWVPITAGAWMAVLAGWKLKTHRAERYDTVDQRMEQYSRKPSRRFRARNRRLSLRESSAAFAEQKTT
jgi:hypothetical protein